MNQYKRALESVRIISLGLALTCLLSFNVAGRNVGLFYNHEFADIEDGNIFSEASNLKSTLEFLGHQVTTFENFSDLDLASIDIIIIPELEKQSLLSSLTGAQLGLYKSYVEEGGGIIVLGVVSSEESNDNNGIEFINYLIDGNLETGGVVFEGKSTKNSSLTSTDFDNAPNVINNNNAMVFITNGFMEGSNIIYNNEGNPGQAAVAQFPKGEGSVLYFGWGWWNALPTGSQDGGWLALLDISVDLLACEDCEGLDPLAGTQGFHFTGKATNGLGVPLSDVEVILESENPEYLVSDEDGVFLSETVLIGSHSLHVNMETTTANRVSSYDMRLMEKHILGLEEFTSAYQYIAADMNGDKKLDLKDLVIIRKILLHREVTETVGANWQWVSADYQFDYTEDPLSQRWNTLQESEIDLESHDIQFIGIKSGDVDFSN